jgi:hypothetical protein
VCCLERASPSCVVLPTHGKIRSLASSFQPNHPAGQSNRSRRMPPVFTHPPFCIKPLCIVLPGHRRGSTGGGGDGHGFRVRLLSQSPALSQGAPSPAQSKERPVKCVCERKCVSDCVLTAWCVLVRILVTAAKHVGRPGCACRTLNEITRVFKNGMVDATRAQGLALPPTCRATRPLPRLAGCCDCSAGGGGGAQAMSSCRAAGVMAQAWVPNGSASDGICLSTLVSHVLRQGPQPCTPLI